MGKLIVALVLSSFALQAQAKTNDANTIAAAYDSAANFLVNGKIDSKLARAFSVLNDSGMADESNEDKAIAILEVDRSAN